MTFQLVWRSPTAAAAAPGDTVGGREKAVGDNVLLDQLGEEYGCFAFYYPAAMPAEALEATLLRLGRASGANLLVNLTSLASPDYRTATRLFDLKRFPVVVVTGTAPLAATPERGATAFVRLDSDALLSNPERTVKCLETLTALFHQGKVAEAMSAGARAERAALVRSVTEAVSGTLGRVLGGLWDFVAQRDIAVSVADGSFELKRSTG